VARIPNRPKGEPPVEGQGKLVANEETFKRLWELGEVQFDHAQVALSFGTTEAKLKKFLRNQTAFLAYEQGRLKAQENLRRAQLDLAQKNATLALFLGRQYMGQGQVQGHGDQRGDGDGQGFDLAAAQQELGRRMAALTTDVAAPEGAQGA